MIGLRTRAFVRRNHVTLGWTLFLILYGLLCAVGGYLVRQFAQLY
jgi:hypothetical protein